MCNEIYDHITSLLLGSQDERKTQTQWLLVTSSFMNNIWRGL